MNSECEGVWLSGTDNMYSRKRRRSAEETELSKKSRGENGCGLAEEKQNDLSMCGMTDTHTVLPGRQVQMQLLTGLLSRVKREEAFVYNINFNCPYFSSPSSLLVCMCMAPGVLAKP